MTLEPASLVFAIRLENSHKGLWNGLIHENTFFQF